MVEAGGGGRAVVTPSSASASRPRPRGRARGRGRRWRLGGVEQQGRTLNETLQNLVTRLRSKLEIFKQRDRRNSDKVRNLSMRTCSVRSTWKPRSKLPSCVRKILGSQKRPPAPPSASGFYPRALAKVARSKGATQAGWRAGGDDSSGDSDDGAAEDSGSVFDTGFWASGEKKDGGKGGEAEAALEEKTPESEPPVSPGTSRRSLAAFVSSASVASSQAGQDAKLCESSASVSKARSADSDSDDDGEARRSSATESLFEESFWKQEDAEDEKKTGDADDDDDTPRRPSLPAIINDPVARNYY